MRTNEGSAVSWIDLSEACRVTVTRKTGEFVDGRRYTSLDTAHAAIAAAERSGLVADLYMENP